MRQHRNWLISQQCIYGGSSYTLFINRSFVLNLSHHTHRNTRTALCLLLIICIFSVLKREQFWSRWWRSLCQICDFAPSSGHPDYICPLVLTSATQELFSCRADNDVTRENPYKLLRKDDIIQDMRNRAAVSDFSPFKKAVLVRAFPYPPSLLLYISFSSSVLLHFLTYNSITYSFSFSGC